MRPRWRRCALAAILTLAATLRITRITETPPGPSSDEACCAVDARYLGLSGRDHHGERFPLYLKGLDDHRDAAFTYLAVPLVLASDDSLFAIRLLAAAIGLATVLLTYLAGGRLLDERAGLWAALFLAVNPQHVLWSRLGFEIILTPMAMMLSLLAYDISRRRPRIGPTLLAASLLAVIYSGPMGKPLAVLLLLTYLACPLGRTGSPAPPKRAFAWGLIVLVIGTMPAWWSICQGKGGIARYRQIGIQADSAAGYLAQVARNYATYYSPAYLLLPQGGGAPDLPFAGKLGYPEFACLLVGAVCLLRDRPPATRLLLLLLLLFPIPAATTGTIASGRVLFGMPILCLAAGYGASRLVGAGRRPWAAAALIAGSLATAGLTMLDLLTTTPPHLDLFFYGPTRRVVAAAIELRRPDERLILDPRVRHAYLYYLALARPPVVADGPKRVFVVPPSEALAAVPALQGVFVTTSAEPIPGTRVLYRGEFFSVKVRRRAADLTPRP
jgi:4-amino-4-deoxy-L-arabinose transferase-like glycosyltransferase